MQENIYPSDVVISDTSSLSNLKKIGKIDLLKSLYNSVTITPEILEEYEKRFEDKLPEWIVVKKVYDREKVFELNKDFGLGESSAMVFAMENPNTLIIIDDQDAKMYASNIGLAVIGTIGVIKQAVDKKIIKSKAEANCLFDEIKNEGGWISDELLKDIKYNIPNIEEMKCYKHEIKKDKIIDFRGNEVNLVSMEILYENENIFKLNCKDKKGNDVYVLQKIKEGDANNWYFDKNFNKESAINFIYGYNKEIENKKKNILKI
jgi:predicted nucleic acid-binding protein